MSELFRDEDRDREEQRQMEAIRRHNRVNFKALLMTLAIVIAPFLALLLSVDLALGVLAAGLLFSTWLTWAGSSQVGPSLKSNLKMAALLNFGVFLVVVAVLALRLSA
jgi:uncharacterized membrane protein